MSAVWCWSGKSGTHHPPLCKMRQIVLRQIQINIDHLTMTPVDPTRDLILRLHRLLSCTSNYSLMFGRVHASQRPLVEGILEPTVVVSKRKLFSYWRMYSAVVMTMYVTRQGVLSTLDSPSQTADSAERWKRQLASNQPR